MQTRYNQSMLKLLGDDPEFLESSSFDIPEELLNYYAGGFVEQEGCVIPARFSTGHDYEISLKPLHDGTNDEIAVECGISHLHIESFLKAPISRYELARLGCDFAWVLRQQLLASKTTGPFQVIVSVEIPKDDTIPGSSCTVRYHRMRRGNRWLALDLETYKFEAILSLSF